MLTDEQKHKAEVIWMDLGPDAPRLSDIMANMEAQLASQNDSPSTDEHGSEQ